MEFYRSFGKNIYHINYCKKFYFHETNYKLDYFELFYHLFLAQRIDKYTSVISLNKKN